MYYDIFNGDADGICALIQLRLAEPRKASLITGIKRDIQLLTKINAQPGDQLTVLDISMQKNSLQLNQFLANGASVFYADHHQAGDLPLHPNLTALIDTSSDTCTSLIINKYLENQFPLWAITAAFGDNFHLSAEHLANTINLDTQNLQLLNNLGTYVNYNAYGSCLEDLHFMPDKLYREMAEYISPLDFIASSSAIYQQLENGYLEDMHSAEQVQPEYVTDNVAVFILPDQAWARRVSGVFSNNLANQYPDRAHAVVTYTPANDYQVSVRAPLNNKVKADELCASFATGGGRRAAAGINHLPPTGLTEFIAKLSQTYP
ncbi:MAG TPA: DHH family phosphoesterase [Methyloprofundus sp.]|uniref:DHH family phosphoesterase n=1 Tax=Methyloprofundus sp. TaxID=2020875 RepID=UPI0017E4B2BC|nr:DHH family phosphoesterase [Methyloprofundus sp.]HIG64591.1 DHH family phosphoesterase [Methyloprofundus sp.]HIL78480.1 DHH family phosphoesterase [Methylococcales bacterium]